MQRRNGTSNVTDVPPQPADHGFGRDLLAHLRISIVATLVLAAIVCGIYPAVVWGLAQVMFHRQANGSLIGKDGKPVSDDRDAVGSELIGQNFSDAKYFHPRPSAAGSGYDATSSSGSNLGPTSAKLMFGTTKDFAFTVFAAGKSHTAVVPVSGRVQGVVAEVTKTAISVTPQGGPATKTTYALDPAVAEPNATVSFHGRTVHATTIPVGALVELKLSDKTPSTVTAINTADQEIDGGASAVDTSGNKITLDDSSHTVINVDPKNTVFVVDGKTNAKLEDITPEMNVHAAVSFQMDFDGIADRVIHYCQDNKIDYKSSVPDSAFMDADGVDDVKLITAFNAASTPTIAPELAKPIPADAVTGSGSGLDPHISRANALLQAQRVAEARRMSFDRVKDLIGQYTDPASMGIFGEPGVNVLRLNLALDQAAPVTPAPASTSPATQPASQP